MGLLDSFKNWFTEEEPEDVIEPGDAFAKDYQSEKIYNLNNADYCLYLEKPTEYKEAQRLANQLKAGNVLIISLANLPKDDYRRLIDFLSGVVLAKNGMIKKISQDILICTPANVKMLNHKQ